MKLIGLHHGQVSIPVGAEDEAKDFYCGLLGLLEIPKPESLKGRGGFWVQLGSIQIHFGAENGINRQATKSHLAYQASGISHWKESLARKGIEILDGIPIPGYERFEFRDPFGNRVEFIEPLD